MKAFVWNGQARNDADHTIIIGFIFIEDGKWALQINGNGEITTERDARDLLRIITGLDLWRPIT